MKLFRNLAIGVLVFGFLLVNLSLFQVDTTEHAIVTQFGEPVRVLVEPGLYVKLPDPIQNVKTINTQLQIYNLPQAEFLTADKKNIVVEAYVTWQVNDALAFLKKVRDHSGARVRLNDIVKSELGAALGKVELGNLVTVDSSSTRLLDTLRSVTQSVTGRTEPYGFAVTDVQLKQLMFPNANLPSVFQRMRSERESIARQFRSEGTEQAARIRATADTAKAEILAQAGRRAAEIRGEADAEAIAIYAGAYGKDPEFYKFSRTLDAYGKFIDGNTTLILPSDSELFRYLDPAAVLITPTISATLDSSDGSSVAADLEDVALP